MGFFSQLCEGCQHPLLSIYASNHVNDWMRQAVVITPSGSLIKGEYDGYGRVDGHDAIVGYDSTCWHFACWRAAGSPTEYRGASADAPDQGFFFDTEHDIPEPTGGRV